MKDLGVAWCSMDDAARQPYRTIAHAKHITGRYAEESGTDESVKSNDDIDFLGAGLASDSMWGIGDGAGPLSPEHMTRPLFTEQFEKDMEEWLAGVGKVVQHEPDALSSIGLTYDCPCNPMRCECTADVESAQIMLDRLKQALPLEPLEVFVVVAGDTTHAVMVAQRIGRPWKLSLL